LSELCAGKEVLVVDQNGSCRTATVGRVKIESRPLILVEAKVSSPFTISSSFHFNVLILLKPTFASYLKKRLSYFILCITSTNISILNGNILLKLNVHESY
jgi:3-dehydroquinate synthase II